MWYVPSHLTTPLTVSRALIEWKSLTIWISHYNIFKWFYKHENDLNNLLGADHFIQAEFEYME
jgi:hypothetical protein